MMIERDFLINELRNGNVKVTFTKLDGTERVMLCTLQESVVVPYERKTERVKQVNEDTLPVWDLDNDAWRSFKLSSITGIETGVIVEFKE